MQKMPFMKKVYTAAGDSIRVSVTPWFRLFTQDINLLFFISIKVVKHYKTNNLLLRDFAKGV